MLERAVRILSAQDRLTTFLSPGPKRAQREGRSMKAGEYEGWNKLLGEHFPLRGDDEQPNVRGFSKVTADLIAR